MRIIAGTARGRSLKLPKNATLRPTSDRVKETLFNVLGQFFDGERVLDLYAGVGSLSLEALSRGASHVTCVEKDRWNAEALLANASTLGFADRVTLLQVPVERVWSRLANGRFQLVFSDPPYASGAGAQTLQSLASPGLVEPGARVVLEHDKREETPERAGPFEREDLRAFGDTVLSFYRHVGAART